jgi:uncharacterized protein (TIGR03492 family)
LPPSQPFQPFPQPSAQRFSQRSAQPLDRPSLRLLCLSNGHGEDAIAVQILQALQQQPQPPQVFALPIVGQGRAYVKQGIPLIGPVKSMPSGGFIHMDGRQLARDVQGGLVKLTLEQMGAVRSWVSAAGEAHSKSLILAVGDVVPLGMACWSGAEYGFVGTAKSEYYVRDEAGLLARSSWWDDRIERWTGCVYLPWERWLLSRSRCRAVFPRDELTAETLRRSQIPAFALGNPMMDGLEPIAPRPDRSSFDQTNLDRANPMVLLLPGSRPPEAYANWEQLLMAAATVEPELRSQPLWFLAAIAPGLDLSLLQAPLVAHGWQPTQEPLAGFADQTAPVFTCQNAKLLLSAAFGDCLDWADWAIAMAGTATEQFVGLGKPAVIVPGQGPQFTPAFAEAQSRLLGESVILVTDPAQVGQVAKQVLHPDRLHRIAANGQRRMGTAGSADRIAECLMQLGQN